MRKLLLLLAVAGLVSATATGAAAASTGSGGSTGTGSVFVPNPVQSLGDESLTDQKDADAAVPAAAYHNVTLTHLDGSGHLRGDYAAIVGETGSPAYQHLPLHASPR
jgi:zinc metalloprotease ZmpB